MAVTYGFFNSVNDDRVYNADQISEYFLKLISNGVFATPTNAMQVQAASGMIVNVTPGWGFINCKWVKNDNLYPLTVDASDIILNRIDRVVLHLDNSVPYRSISIQIKKGTTAATPTPPELTRTGDIYELSLAQIYVGAGVEAITQAEITDERPDVNVCGFITGLIDQIDTTNLFAQFTSAFTQWFDEIKDIVKHTTIVMQYQSKYETTTAEESTIPIQIPEYNETLDILYVYINGLKLIPEVDYTIDGTNIELTSALTVIGTPVEFEVLKSVDTEDAESIATTILQLYNKVEQHESRIEALEDRADTIDTRLGGLSFIKISKADFDALTNKDPDTIYYVYDTNGKITQYMGVTEVNKAGITAGAIIANLQNRTAMVVGNITEV